MRRKRAMAEAAELVDIEPRLAPHVQPHESAVDTAEPDPDQHEAAPEPVPADR